MTVELMREAVVLAVHNVELPQPNRALGHLENLSDFLVKLDYARRLGDSQLIAGARVFDCVVVADIEAVMINEMLVGYERHVAVQSRLLALASSQKLLLFLLLTALTRNRPLARLTFSKRLLKCRGMSHTCTLHRLSPISAAVSCGGEQRASERLTDFILLDVNKHIGVRTRSTGSLVLIAAIVARNRLSNRAASDDVVVEFAPLKRGASNLAIDAKEFDLPSDCQF